METEDDAIMLFKSHEKPVGIPHLMSEIGKLSDEQNLLLQKAAFVGMTVEEADAYKRRAAEIKKLVKELKTVSPEQSSAPGGHHEQETQETARHR